MSPVMTHLPYSSTSVLKLASLPPSKSLLNFSIFPSYRLTQSGPKGNLTAFPSAPFNTPPANPIPETASTILAAAFSASPG